jgi:hypothetical protein
MSRRILAVASGGGHWVQLMRLRGAFEGLDVAFASVKQAYSQEVEGHRFYVFRDVNRWDRWGFVVLIVQVLWVLLKERPDILLTTGSAPGYIALRLAKQIFRIRTVWIDSIANCERMSWSGELAGKHADVWLSQWPHLARDGGPKYWGAVL